MQSVGDMEPRRDGLMVPDAMPDFRPTLGPTASFLWGGLLGAAGLASWLFLVTRVPDSAICSLVGNTPGCGNLGPTIFLCGAVPAPFAFAGPIAVLSRKHLHAGLFLVSAGACPFVLSIVALWIALSSGAGWH